MTKIKYSIDEGLLNIMPEYTRGVIVFRDIDNSSSNEAIFNNFQSEVRRLCRLLSGQNLNELEIVRKWNKAFKTVGIKSEYKPSLEALMKRVVNKPDSFSPINQLVDLGNLCSLKFETSIGVHPLNADLCDMSLCFAKGTEDFIAFGKDSVTHPNEGEVVLLAGNTILTRNWVWRQGKLSMITSETKDIFINVDSIGVALREAKSLAEEVAGVFKAAFHTDYAIQMLHKGNLEISF